VALDTGRGVLRAVAEHLPAAGHCPGGEWPGRADGPGSFMARLRQSNPNPHPILYRHTLSRIQILRDTVWSISE
jgi:hypothetical protein